MKMIILAYMLIAMVLLGCGITGMKDKTREFIPGTYIRFSKHEFGEEYDTLIITIKNSSANEFKILRKWKYERSIDGGKPEPEYKKKMTTVLYDPAHKILKETETGKIYSIDTWAKTLFNGPVKYQKL